MSWHDVPTYFFGGAFLANFCPHFIAGVSGQRFHSPFAKPPFRGLSSPVVNILWGGFNLAMAYTLLVAVGDFQPRQPEQALVVGLGFVLASVGIARSLGRMRPSPQA